jgi:hypothetical protein
MTMRTVRTRGERRRLARRIRRQMTRYLYLTGAPRWRDPVKARATLVAANANLARLMTLHQTSMTQAAAARKR